MSGVLTPVPAREAATAPRPSATIHARMERHVRLGLILIGLLVIGLGGLSALVGNAGAVVAGGELVTATNVQTVQHPGGGVVSQILVRDGQRVAAGQVLIRFDPTTTGASFNIVSDTVVELQAKQARLIAERDGLPALTFPAALTARAAQPNVAAILASERRLFALHATARAGARAQFREQQSQLRQQISGYEEQIAAKRRQVELIRSELAGMRSLYDQGLAPLTRVNALERGLADLQGAIGQLEAAIAESRGRISEIGVQILQLDQQDATRAGQDLNETQARLAEFEQREVASRQDYDRLSVRAPRAGVVDHLAVHTVGGVVAAGDPILVIVPDDGRLSAEVRARPTDIEQLYVGQPARVRLAALNQRTTPELAGQVTRVAAEPTTDPRSGARYYVVAIDVPASEVRRLGAVRLRAGMPVEAFIHTRDRSLLSFVTRPFTDQMERAFRED